MKYLSAILLSVLILSIGAQAQQGQGSGAKTYAEIISASSTAVVKGAPFSAEAVSESVQVLADGNKISRSYTTKLFRDSEGRFRRESVSGVRREGDTAAAGAGFGYTTSNGALTSFGFSEMISIFDPVANQRFIIMPSAKTVRRMTTVPGKAEGAVIVNGQALSPAAKAQVEADAAQKTNIVVLPVLATTTVSGGFGVGGFGSAGKTESLGTRSFEGVEAEGTRTVTTIPAGAIGNERDIEIVYERWYSKDLQLIVYSKHSDPRFGDQIYRLTNISRSEPDRSLFTPPADYKIVSEPTFNVVTTTKSTSVQGKKQQ